ncbi:hypothetical protein COCCU_02280 [Corynebacterium occultum]|uniref:Uncharacterized protein n=1 Tax=Corynebacterium occultum TaxID=2675219 RepID=A0A6B8W8S8_9CORY|nr:hypothetical protein [Corynebacterium occultum]QGU06410.1 hypothetical protein COCCU_02280 [Corynebacterium occultum]
MKDPARIAPVIAELQETWEAQPDLSLPTLFGLLENRGIGWGSGDEELVQALRELRRHNPLEVRGHSRSADLEAGIPGQEVPGRFLVETVSPDHRVTIDPFRIGVRRVTADGEQPQPGVWGFERIRRCRVAEPLVIRDESGIDHRLGVVSRITLLNERPLAEVGTLDGMERRDIGERVYQLILGEGSSALLTHGLWVFNISRRAVAQRRLKWEKLLSATPGQVLRVRQAGNGEDVELGELLRIIPLEA